MFRDTVKSTLLNKSAALLLPVLITTAGNSPAQTETIQTGVGGNIASVDIINGSREKKLFRPGLSLKTLGNDPEPTVERLMSAGQLGGALYPTEDIESR